MSEETEHRRHGGESDDLEQLETRRVDTVDASRDREALFASHRPGETLGRYVLLRPLGAGGMSVVWLAFDPELDRRVALKLMHEGPRTTTTGAQRLLREAQALARLSHANVVHVYDVGIVGGEVYLAMELVDGVTLKEWLVQTPRTWTEILGTLASAGAGLAAAHDAGLVHLDFKPTNVVVGHDGSVCVVDFGLARAPSDIPIRSSDDPSSRPSGPDLSSRPSGPDLSSRPSGPEWAAPRSGAHRLGERLTEDGAVLGTPGYIPPEVLAGRAADGRADQFSFCVTAWEALFGERPVEAEPKRSHSSRGAPMRAVVVPRVIRTALARGLAADPEQRFASMRELLVAIRPRHGVRRVAYLGAGLLGVVGLVAVRGPWADPPLDPCEVAANGLVDVWNPARAGELQLTFTQTSAAFAADTWTTAARVIDIHAEEWSRQARDACEARIVRADQSAETHELRTACLDESRNKLEELLRLFEDPDVSIVEHAVTAAVGIGDPAACADTEVLHAEASLPDDPTVRARVDELRRAAQRAAVMTDAGRVNEAWAAIAPVLAEARTLGHAATLAFVLRVAGNIRGGLGDPHRASELLNESIVQSEAAGLDQLRLLIYAELAYVFGHQLRDHKRGVYAAEAAMALHTRVGGTNDHKMRLLVTQGILASGAGEYDRALDLYEQALALARPDDPVLPTVLLDLGGVHYEHGKFALALDYYQRSYDLQLAQLGPNHPSTALVLENRGNAQQALGNFDAALSDQERSLAVHEATGLTSGISFALQLNNVGVVLSGMQRYPEAVTYYSRARVALGAQHEMHPLTGVLLTNLAEARLAEGQPGEALGLYRSALGKLEQTMGDRHQYVGVALTGVGLCELDLGEHEAARGHLARALTIHAMGGDPVQRAETQLGLARAIVMAGAKGEIASARDYARSAREGFIAAGPRGVSGRDRADALLGEIGE